LTQSAARTPQTAGNNRQEAATSSSVAAATAASIPPKTIVYWLSVGFCVKMAQKEQQKNLEWQL